MRGIPDALRNAVRLRYALRHEIGRGGMATVYLAHDERHGRQVALKVLRPDLAASIGTDRFLKEIEIAARLTHPHIVPLYDSGEAQGFLYYVMPFIEGESLRARLNRERQLPLPAAAEITFDIADALHYAHRLNVLHRDIKPENILFSEGHAVVADFGIAKAVSTAVDAALTRTGFALGTPGYMSPEQAAGIRGVDGRTDVYGLACVTYEMLVGETPGLWVTDEAARLGRFIDASPEHRELLERLPGRIEQTLVRALALRPSERFPNPGAFADGLRAAFGARPRYRDSQVEQILERAVELDAEDATTDTEDVQLTQGAVEQVAAEAGIPPARVREAVRDLARAGGATPRTPRSTWSWFLGRPASIRVERVVDGEVPTSAFPAMVDETRRTLGKVGHVSTLGTSLAWSTMTPEGAGRSVQLSITPRGDQTTIYIEEQLTAVAGGLFGGIMGGGGGAGLGLGLALAIETLQGPVLAAVFALISAGGTWALARSIFVGVARKRHAQLAGLADRLADHAAQAARTGLQRQDLPQSGLLGGGR